MTDDAVAPQSQQLLIHGTVDTEIQLSLAQTADNAYFQLNGKTLTLVRPLDRESVPAGLNTLDVQVLCRDIHTNRQRTIVVTVTVTDRNDNAPRFVNLPYHVEINELTPVGTTVFRMLSAVDADKSANGLVNFEVEQGDGSVPDDSSYFAHQTCPTRALSISQGR
ncbi:PREDICTED: cadherin-related family member 2-like [Priapulus caudatus]|uniref:Cadherin-related family member 2-like n=1 Tax=Priapulus caudatus TaxID=37621 RepID=A0ABM1F063_PRICU|nr:PREDICTED: cadherin-related family member 2-like [Priapulus caudatus]